MRLLAILLHAIPPVASAAAPEIVTVRATDEWVATGVTLAAGQSFAVEASGAIRPVRMNVTEAIGGADFDRRVSPEGTYVWPRDYAARGSRRPRAPGRFALPAIDDGPHPAFCLIGRIGLTGQPFYIGRSYRGTAAEGGRLWLGVNDDDVRDNAGAWTATVALNAPAAPPAAPASILEPRPAGRPRPKSRVLLLYVDGLRPDVVHEMARAGFLPNIRRLFLEGGTECREAFTTFPSNTLVANGALFTGLFPDRTAIKSQNQFERTTGALRGQVGELLPDWLTVRVQGPRVSDLLDKFAPENTDRFLRSRGIALMSRHLGKAYRFTVLPIAPMNPPPLWLHRALNTIRNPFAPSLEIPGSLDVINARYVMEDVLGDPDTRVITAWFPLTDKVSHSTARGQFGPARREIAVFDRLLGQMLVQLWRVGWDRSTYIILVSDHGHLGGEREPNRRANLARDLFHGDLGANVRVVGQSWTLPGSNPRRFVFLDHQAWGQAAIYLPKGSYHHGGWQRNTFAELMTYDLGPNRGTVNLIEAVSGFRGPEWQPGLPNPVDLVCVKLDAHRVLVLRGAENQALIHHRVDADGIERFRYEPARRVRLGPAGELVIESQDERDDPLGYLRDASVTAALGGEAPALEWLRGWQDAQAWLHATAGSQYPDAVVGIAKFFAWKPPVEDLADARDPDLLVTAARGWTFRSDGTSGTDHGQPLREAMQISLFVAGPNIRRGVLTEPHRIVDILPTVLEMAGRSYDPAQLDGRAITSLYE